MLMSFSWYLGKDGITEPYVKGTCEVCPLLELLLSLSSICHAPLQLRTGGKETAHGNLQNGKTLKAEPGSNLFAPHLLL